MNNKKQQTEITEDKNNTAGTEPDNNEHTALSLNQLKLWKMQLIICMRK